MHSTRREEILHPALKAQIMTSSLVSRDRMRSDTRTQANSRGSLPTPVRIYLAPTSGRRLVLPFRRVDRQCEHRMYLVPPVPWRLRVENEGPRRDDVIAHFWDWDAIVVATAG